MVRSKATKISKPSKEPTQPVNKQEYFNNCHRTYSCIHCRAHLANHNELISKLFQGNHGRAYLFNKVVNIGCKQAVQRELLTGLHAVADIYCDNCETTLGWKYEQAFVPSQKYKEGKYIIELVHMLKENDWDLTSYNTKELLEEAHKSQRKQECRESRVSAYRAFNKTKIVPRDEKINLNRETLAYSHNQLTNGDNSHIETNVDTSQNQQSNQHQNNQLAGEENTPHTITGNNLNELNTSQISNEILSDGIELLEISMDKIQVFISEDEKNRVNNSSKNSLCSSRSHSDLSSTSSEIVDNKATCGSSASGTSSIMAETSYHKLNNNSPNEINLEGNEPLPN